MSDDENQKKIHGILAIPGKPIGPDPFTILAEDAKLEFPLPPGVEQRRDGALIVVGEVKLPAGTYHDGSVVDDFERLWKDQAETQKVLGLDPRTLTPTERDEAAKDMILGLFEEVQELAKDTLGYKAHVLKRKRVEKVNVADNVVDLLKYTLAYAQLYRLTPDDVMEAWRRKTSTFNDRARGERLELERHTLVATIDLDGVVVDLSSWQDKLKESQGGAPMNDKTVAMLESLKEDFYRDGGFRTLPPMPGAVEGMRALAALGISLVIITARPQWQYKRVYGDTVEWLDKHGVPRDLILFNKDKAEAIYEHVLPARPMFHVEDRSKHALEVANIGVPVKLLGGAGAELAAHPLIEPVSSWVEIVNAARAAVKEAGR